MAKLKKSGMQTGLAALFLSISLAGQVWAAGPADGQAGVPYDSQTADPGQAGVSSAGQAADPGQAGMPAAGQAADPGQTGVPTAGQAADPGNTGAGSVQAAVRPEAGIIEVESGFVDAKGTFWKMKSGSGFLIANKEHDTYIVTNSSNVSNTPGKIKKFCKKHAIDTENMQLANTIRVVVTGDVTASAEVVMKSAERDYCVLSAANVVSQKESLKIGNSANVQVNDPVYAYGFPKQTDAQAALEYSELDVRPIQGAVTLTDAYQDNGVYLAHSAPVMQGYEGGPLLDADGYVIGLNCKQSPEEDTGIAYAVPIDEISAVLDNFSIYYGSRAIDEAYAQLTGAYQECTRILEAGGYKQESVERLQQALETADEVMKLEEPSAAVFTNAYQTLWAARDLLEPKTKTLTIVMAVLAACDGLLLIWMLILAVKNAREKKQMEMQRVQPAYAGQRAGAGSGGRQGAGFRGADAGTGGFDGAHAGIGAGSRGMHAGSGYGGANAGFGAGSGGANAGFGAGYGGANAGPGADYSGVNAGAGAYAGRQNAANYRQPVAPPAGRRLRMIRQKTGQTVVLNKNQFIIGKSQTLADFALADNQTVSRKHAMLFEDNGGWYVDDLNSLNGTCVNGAKVVPGQPVKLRSGDEITLSDEAFLVQD